MDEYKHIERCIGKYIGEKYTRAVEIGIGRNTDAAEIVAGAGCLLHTTDIKTLQLPENLLFAADDIFSPDISLYQGAEVLYAIRPAIEMVPPLSLIHI